MVDFKVSRRVARLVGQIARRAVAEFPELNLNATEVEMDIVATHNNGCPLDLPKLFAADRSNFAHDILGIRKTLDRTTGELPETFCPRCARPEVVA